MQTNSSLKAAALILFFALSALAQQPGPTAADYFRAGLAAQRAGQHEEALRQYAAAIKLDPKDFGAQFNSGASYMVLHKPDDALKASRARMAAPGLLC